jgi:hypothetical protein
MLRAIHEREDRWDEVDPDTEFASIGESIDLSEDESFALFKLLVDEHYVYPGRILHAGARCQGLRAVSSDVATILRQSGTTCGFTTRGAKSGSRSVAHASSPIHG